MASRSEEALGRMAAESTAGCESPQLLIGGLGMGFTLRAALDAVIAGRPVTENQKPSLGCNIKWIEGSEPEYFNSAGIS